MSPHMNEDVLFVFVSDFYLFPVALFQLLVFGGHGTGGWITRYDIYHNDCVILDRGL